MKISSKNINYNKCVGGVVFALPPPHLPIQDRFKKILYYKLFERVSTTASNTATDVSDASNISELLKKAD